MADDVRFALMADGREIAYRIMSEAAGPAVLHTHGVTIPVEILDEDPMYHRFLRVLGGCGRLVVFDKPGTGASDPFDPDRDYLDQTVDAYLAVLDALDEQAGWLVGHEACETALLARNHRPRLLGAALLDPFSPDGPVPFDLAASIADRHRDDPAVIAPSRADDLEYRKWLRRGKRIGTSGVQARANQKAFSNSLQRAWATAKPIDGAPPVLLIHRRDGLDISHLRWWARIFPDAERVTVEGTDITIAALDAGVVAEVMASFISGTPIEAPSERQLLAVFFTDLVASTQTASARGDAVWRSTLDRYEAELRRTIQRHHGNVVKTTGDGALASFPSGSEALAAAVELRSATHELKLECRTGIHVGEVEQRVNDIGGIAVHLAARVMGEAGPGEIIASSAVAQTAVGGRFRFKDLGARTLSGIDEDWHLFLVEPDR